VGKLGARLRLSLASLAVGAALVACAARTGLDSIDVDAGESLDGTVVDHALDRRDVALDASSDASDAIDALDAIEVLDVATDGPVALCGVCSADLNANETPVGPNQFQGAQWLAYELPIACDQYAAWIAIHDDSAFVRVYADDGTGRPGAQLVAPTATQPIANGWFVIAANIQLQGGHSYYVATSITPYSGSTHTAWSTTGTITRYWGSFDSQGGNWQGPYENPPMIRAGDCE